MSGPTAELRGLGLQIWGLRKPRKLLIYSYMCTLTRTFSHSSTPHRPLHLRSKRINTSSKSRWTENTQSWNVFDPNNAAKSHIAFKSINYYCLLTVWIKAIEIFRCIRTMRYTQLGILALVTLSVFTNIRIRKDKIKMPQITTHNILHAALIL